MIENNLPVAVSQYISYHESESNCRRFSLDFLSQFHQPRRAFELQPTKLFTWAVTGLLIQMISIGMLHGTLSPTRLQPKRQEKKE